MYHSKIVAIAVVVDDDGIDDFIIVVVSFAATARY